LDLTLLSFEKTGSLYLNQLSSMYIYEMCVSFSLNLFEFFFLYYFFELNNIEIEKYDLFKLILIRNKLFFICIIYNTQTPKIIWFKTLTAAE
jgi:hypothetical protein